MDYLYTNFPCRCGDPADPKTEEKRRKLDFRLQEAYDFVQAGPEHFWTYAVQVLNWNYQIRITGLPNDQWSAIEAERNWGPGPHGKIRIQCDLLEDGLADLLLWARDTFESSEEV